MQVKRARGRLNVQCSRSRGGPRRRTSRSRCTASTPARAAGELVASPSLRCPSRTTAPSGPTSSTASPGSKRPSTRATPTASRLAPSLGQRAARALVDVQASCHRLAVAQPELERGRCALARREARSARLAGDDRAEHVRRRHPAAITVGIPADSGELGGAGSCSRMPPLPSGEPSPSSAAPASVAQLEQLGTGRSRRARVHAVDLRQQHEQPRADEDGHLRGERVVVAEGDLVRRGRVVLVHDRHGSEREQRGERVAGVQVRPHGRPRPPRSAAPARRPAPRGRARRPRRPAASPGRAPRRPAASARCAGATLRPSRGSPSAIAPDETTQTGVPPRTSSPISRARARSTDRRTRPPAPATSDEPSLTTTGRLTAPACRRRRRGTAAATGRGRSRARAGPGVQSTLIPVSGAPVSAKPSVNRVVACQNAAVPR